MHDKQPEHRQLWQAPELKVLDVNEHTLANVGPSSDGFTFSS
jgi:hypothetical protein